MFSDHPRKIFMKFEHPKNLADDPANDRPAGRKSVGPTSNFYESYKENRNRGGPCTKRDHIMLKLFVGTLLIVFAAQSRQAQVSVAFQNYLRTVQCPRKTGLGRDLAQRILSWAEGKACSRN
jgi:hypothetical protein